MPAIGVGLLWWGYWWGIGGVSMAKGWNNNFLQLANPIRPPKFTTACYVGTGVWPTGRAADSGACAGKAGRGVNPATGGGVASRAPFVPSKPGSCPAGFTWNKQLGACVPRLGAEH